jgi:hypothetical protein
MGGKIVTGMCSNERGFCEKIGYCGCDAYISPDAWSRRGGCPLSTVPSPEVVKAQKKVNALKASKRKARGK